MSSTLAADDVTDNPTTEAALPTGSNDNLDETNVDQNSNSITENAQESNASEDPVNVVDATEQTTDSNLEDQSNVNIPTEENDNLTTEQNTGSTETSSIQNGDDSSTNAPQVPAATTLPPFSCSESGVGRFPHLGNCHEYYYCWDSVHDHVTFSCKTKVFDPITKFCVNNWAHCESTPKCEMDRQVMADPDDATAYFVCKLRQDPINPGFLVIKDKCHPDREFDGELGFCKRIGPEPESSSSESDESKEKKFECSVPGIFIDIHDETKFYECIVKNISKGKLKTIHRECPKNLVFSMEDKRCVPL